MSNMENITNIFDAAYEVTKHYSGMEWSIGCILKEDAYGNEQRWFMKIVDGEYVFECITGVTINSESYKDKLRCYFEYSLGKINYIFFKARKWGQDDMVVFDNMTMKIHDALVDLKNIYQFELEHKKKVKIRV